MDHSLSIHLLKGILVASRFWATMNKGAVHICIQCRHKYSTFFREILRRFLEHPIRVCLVLFEMVKLYPKVAAPFCISTSNAWDFLLLHILSSIWCVSVPDFDHPYGCEEEKKSTEDEVVGWHHHFNRHELGQTLGGGEGTGKPGVLQSMGSQRMGHNLVTEQQQ